MKAGMHRTGFSPSGSLEGRLAWVGSGRQGEVCVRRSRDGSDVGHGLGVTVMLISDWISRAVLLESGG
jgi:hypothetical protein